MKIHEFARENRISVRTVRYYIQLGLLHPGKKDGQLYFDQASSLELKEILELKGDGFLLQEVGEWHGNGMTVWSCRRKNIVN